jgi:hypothetical protein
MNETASIGDSCVAKKCFLQLLFVATIAAWSQVPLQRAAVAQIDPDDTGQGTKLGLAERHNSGQVGSVTLLVRGPQLTLVVLRVASVPPGRLEPARVSRTRSCSRRARGSAAAWDLAPVTGGVSSSAVPLPVDRLLAGNYLVEVFARKGSTVRVSCGELYR